MPLGDPLQLLVVAVERALAAAPSTLKVERSAPVVVEDVAVLLGA